MRPFGILLFVAVSCGIFTATPGLAQPGDLTPDREFFEQQAAIYQRWLEHTGMGRYLFVREVKVQPKQLSLYLQFRFTELDSILSAWEALKIGFEAQSPLSLEQQLFYKMTALMEVRQSIADVQIYDTYDLRKEELFMRGIYFDAGQVQVTGNDPKSFTGNFALTHPRFDGKQPVAGSLDQLRSKQELFAQIEAYARQKYESRLCDQVKPVLRVLEDEAVLRFQVEELCKEVLVHADQPTLCRILRAFGYDCNWVKREMLIFTFAVAYQEGKTLLTVEIDGKYGSGMYQQAQRGGYLSMEIDFDHELQTYGQEFMTSLKRALR